MVAATLFVASFGIGCATTIDDVPLIEESESSATYVEEEMADTTVVAETTTTEKDEAIGEYSDLVVEITTKSPLSKTTAPTTKKATIITTKVAAEPRTMKVEPRTEATTKSETTTVQQTESETTTRTGTTRPTETTTRPKPEATTKKPKPETTTQKPVTQAYGSGSVKITPAEYDYLCRLVYGEFGGGPYEGQVLVAQALYNAMAESGKNAWDTAKAYGYTGSTRKGTNESCKKAVSAVFYEGHRYTSEPVMYFYAPKYMKNGYSAWHETQTFLFEIAGVRFFKRNGT